MPSGNRLAALFCCLVCSTALVAQSRRPSAWEELVRQNPAVVEDGSVTWKERLVLHALSREQAELYFSGRAGAESLRLEDGRTLAEYLNAKLSPPAQVFVPLAAPCPLFSLTVDGGPLWVGALSARPRDLGGQRGEGGGCGIPEEASALLVRATVRSLEGVPARLKLWVAGDPEPPYAIEQGEDPNWPLSYETTLLAPLCGGCPEGGIELRTGRAALVSARAAGYFRPLVAGDAPGGGIRLSTEGSFNNFFGSGAGSSITTGSRNSLFGGVSGGLNTEGDDNSFFGYGSGILNTTGDKNSFFGTFSGANNTASDNSFFGYEAGYSNTTGTQNSFFGANAGHDNTTGNYNSFFGEEAGHSASTAYYNSFFGYQAGFSTTVGQNSFFGYKAGFDNVAGGSNSFFGYLAGEHNSGGNANAFFGFWAGRGNTFGHVNSFFGDEAGSNNTTGDRNSIFGGFAGKSNTTEDNNTFIGALSNGFAGVTNATALGYRAQVSQSNSLVLGSIAGLNSSTSDVKVGIGTDAPQYALHVRRTDGTARVLVEEASGTTAQRTLFQLNNNGGPIFELRNANSGNSWAFSMSAGDQFQFSRFGTGGPEIIVDANGRVRMGPGPNTVFNLSPGGDLTISGGLTANGMSYPSDRNLKERIVPLDGADILDRLAGLPISSWYYRSDPDSRHVGPMAQDFEAAFGVGSDGRTINAMDEAGVTLAAVQGLYEMVKRQEAENVSLRRRIEALERLLDRQAAGKP